MPVWQRFALTGGSRLRRLCAFAMLAALAVPGRSAGQQAQQAPPPAGQEKPAPEKGFPPVVESVDVSVTSVEVVVTDSKGNRVPGLTAADFDNIPYLALKGDYTATSTVCQETVDAINARRAGKHGTAKAEYLKLDDMGILGVTHMMMLDKKNLEIADILLDWVNKNVRSAKH